MNLQGWKGRHKYGFIFHVLRGYTVLQLDFILYLCEGLLIKHSNLEIWKGTRSMSIFEAYRTFVRLSPSFHSGNVEIQVSCLINSS